MAWVEVVPGHAAPFRQRGWGSPAPFLEWTGILVNWHRRRQVEQVAIPNTSQFEPRNSSYFLKKEFSVTWRERFRNVWHGFGWCATAVREAAILLAARQAGVACPEVVAFGEDERRAFVLVRDEAGLSELRAFLPLLSRNEDRNCLADVLGRALAHMHDAGFEHPDLFAKHILVGLKEGLFRFCILDWARARHRRTISWRSRCRDLAALDATMHETLASDRIRLRLLSAYLKALRGSGLPLRRAAQQVRRVAERLREQRNIREIGQPAIPAHDQQFVPIGDGRLLIVRSFHQQIGGELPDWLTRLSEAGSQAEAVTSDTGPSGPEIRSVKSWPRTKSTWELPELAHTLFRLARFGVGAPRLLAAGATATSVFLVTQTEPTTPFDEVFAKAPFLQRCQMLRQVGRIVRQIHEAGYHLPAVEAWPRRLGIGRETGNVVIAKVELLLRSTASWQELAATELNRQRMQLSRTEQMRFLFGYLGASEGTAEMKRLFLRQSTFKERQRAA